MKTKRRGEKKHEKAGPTQLESIRDLMLSTSRRGSWLTLTEIAERTEFGATSISAQLRHLRKRRFGGYLVAKRRRRLRAAAGARAFWEYGVFAGRAVGRDASRTGTEEKASGSPSRLRDGRT